MAGKLTHDANAVMLVGAGAAADLIGEAADAQPGLRPQPLAERVLRVIERREDGRAARPVRKRPTPKPVDDSYWPVSTDVAM